MAIYFLLYVIARALKSFVFRYKKYIECFHYVFCAVFMSSTNVALKEYIHSACQLVLYIDLLWLLSASRLLWIHIWCYMIQALIKITCVCVPSCHLYTKPLHIKVWRVTSLNVFSYSLSNSTSSLPPNHAQEREWADNVCL